MKAQQILVAIRKEPEASRVLEKVMRLVDAHTKVQVVRVIYDERERHRNLPADERWAQRTLTLQAEEEALEVLLDPFRGRIARLESVVVWNRRFYAGVLDVAREIAADLIVKTAEVGSRIGHIVRTPDDWHLLREASCPVLLVKTGNWIARPTILAAVDALDEDHAALSRAVLDMAREVATQIGGVLHLASAYPRMQPLPGEVGTAFDYAQLRSSMLVELETRQKALLHADARTANVPRHVVEGEPHIVLERIADELGAEVVVLGTAARRGLSALVIGNTSEALLHMTQRDVLVVREST